MSNRKWYNKKKVDIDGHDHKKDMHDEFISKKEAFLEAFEKKFDDLKDSFKHDTDIKADWTVDPCKDFDFG